MHMEVLFPGMTNSLDNHVKNWYTLCVEVEMRRGRDYRLNLVLARQHTIPGWIPADPEQLATDRHLQDVERTWIEVVAEQEGLSTRAVSNSLPNLPVMRKGYYSVLQTLLDGALADMDEAQTHQFAESMAKHDLGAVSPAEIQETIDGNDVTLFPNRWMRVPDHVFAQYGRLEDRRPFRGVER